MTTTFLNKKGNNNKNFDYNSFDMIFKNKFFDNDKKNDDNYIDNLLKKAYETIVPWAKKKDTETIYIVFGDNPNKKYTFEKPSFSYTSISPAALNLEWNKAATHLLECAYYAKNPTYDFMLGDTPIKIHGNYIQVGSEIIPTFTSSDFFSPMNKETRINIYNIALEINAIFAA